MRYTTSAGYVLEVGRVDRRRIDRFVVDNPAPEPPMRYAEAFGGVTEGIPVLDDPDYQAELAAYYIKAAHAETEMLAEAITIADEERAVRDLAELHEIQLVPEMTRGTLLAYVVLINEHDMVTVMNEIVYQSTVTEQAIAEAGTAFGAIWGKTPVLNRRLKSSGGTYNPLFEHRKAAVTSGYKWAEFCELPGPKQSEIVAFYRIQAILAVLQADEGRRG